MLPFFLLCLLAAGVHGESDADYLHRLAAATGADIALNWSAGSDPCHGWVRVSCNDDGQVLKINLNGIGLRGWVPGQEGNDSLAHLDLLDLSGNMLGGQLPRLVVPRLERLYLDGNSFTSIPPSFFADMKSLLMFSICNNMQLQPWSLPDNLRNLSDLISFNASSANINGTLPEFLGNTSSLERLNLANNSLGGPVPEGFRSVYINDLDLSNNNFSGPISFIDRLTNLARINLSNNSFTGPLPDFRDGDLQFLSLVFSVAHNRLTGVVPAMLVNMSDLVSVSLAGNLLQGPLPEFQSNVTDDVAVAANTGCFCRLDPGPCDPIVDSLLSIAGALHSPVILAASWRRQDPCAGWLGVHCSGDEDRRKVTGINLSRLGLNGTMDPAFASILSLEAIVLSGNNITGAIPPAIAQLPSLRVLDVSNNGLVGRMPRFNRDVEVWAEGNRELYSVAPPIMRRSTSSTLVVAMLAFAF
jgi:kinase